MLSAKQGHNFPERTKSTSGSQEILLCRQKEIISAKNVPAPNDGSLNCEIPLRLQPGTRDDAQALFLFFSQQALPSRSRSKLFVENLNIACLMFNNKKLIVFSGSGFKKFSARPPIEVGNNQKGAEVKIRSNYLRGVLSFQTCNHTLQ